MADRDSIVRAEGVFRRFGRRMALRGVSLSAAPGEVVALMGANGSGKTTLLRVLAGVLAPTAGGARICGFDVCADSLKARRHLGYLPENTPLYGEMRVAEFLRFRGSLRGLRGSALAGRLRFALEACGLEDLPKAVIGRLPRGLRQRVGFADCLLHAPEVLLLDEPFNGVDPPHAAALRQVVRAEAETRGCAVVFSTHQPLDAALLAGRVVLLDEGRVAAAGTPAELSAGEGAAAEWFAGTAAAGAGGGKAAG